MSGRHGAALVRGRLHAPRLIQLRRRRTPGPAVCLASLLALAFFASPALAAIPGQPCKSAEYLLSQGDTDGAKAIYEEVLTDKENRACALEGLEAIDRLPPESPAPTPDPCASAEALQSANRDSEAEEEFVKLLATPSAVPCATQALQAIPPGGESSLRSTAWYWVKNYWLWAVGLAIFVVLFGRARRPQLVMSDPKDGTGDDLIAKQLAGIGQRAREQLGRDLRRRREGYLRKRQQQQATGIDVERAPVVPLPKSAIDSSAADILSGMKDVAGVGVIARLLSAILRERGVSVTAVIHQDDEDADAKRLGIAYDVADIRGKQSTAWVSGWVARDASTWTSTDRLLEIADRRLAIELLRRKEFFSLWLRWRLRKVQR